VFPSHAPPLAHLRSSLSRRLRRNAAGFAALAGTGWRLVRLAGQGIGATAAPPTLAFAADGRVSGSGGCNNFSGAWREEGAGLRLGPLLATRRACADAAANRLEQVYLAALEATASAAVQPGALVLSTADGRLVRFVPVQ